uniref:Phospholipid-transporting ATPase n=1 Tax=Cyprinodon variegatus TaxID=28743 RepID=A0A3Q2D3L1_CYPVA
YFLYNVVTETNQRKKLEYRIFNMLSVIAEKERRVKANAREYNEKFSYANNHIKTSKYNIFTFLPINLFEQFQRVANAYFVVLLILQLIPEISSLSWFTTIVPLVLVLVITAVKDATDDYFRHKSDQKVNNRQSQVLIRGSLQREKWMNVRVGDIIKLENNQFVAADILLLCSSEPYGLCYIETAELDGEVIIQNSPHKVFTTDQDIHFFFQIFAFLICMGVILAIGNTIWETYIGRGFQVFLPSEEFQSSAVFSGFLTFWSYIIILNTVVPISLYVSVEVLRLGHSFFINWDQKMYFTQTDTPAEARTTTLNEELGQVEFIFSDKTGTLTQNIMVFSKCSINGQTYGDVYDEFNEKVEITEKTACVDFSFNPLLDRGFKFYDSSLVEAVKREESSVQEFFRLLALCHTVMSEEKSEGNLVYQAQSPDEGALVTAARNFGFVFRARTPETITLCEMGRAATYELLAILDFNNVRKRMSVIVRNPKGQIKLYCKGADTIIFDRLDPSSEELMYATSEHLSEFAGEGLRTLALAYKDLSEDYYEVWKKKLYHVSTVIENREEQLAVLYEEIEWDMKLLGATAIEDKLQDGVPETIACLNLADIKIWVLTGDKLETAMNIGYSCNMLRDDMNEVFVISGLTQLEVQQQLRSAKERVIGLSRLSSTGGAEKDDMFLEDSVFEEAIIAEYALIINGHSLAHALEPQLEQTLLDLACLCKTVICCRVTPMQKAQVVELVRRHKRAVTLAVGDGANDVSMIKTAHIGVGISGQEGMQAALASDYSFAQFRFLQRLLLVHGRWSYFRMCNFLAYFFYKNFAFTLVHFWYGFFCGFSAQNSSSYGPYCTVISPVLIWAALVPPFFFCSTTGSFFFLRNPNFPTTQNDSTKYRKCCEIQQSQRNKIPSISVFALWSQVRHLQQSRKRHRPQEQSLRRVRRTSSRRSAYAFSHQQGYGELITSGKNMRMSEISSTHSLERTAQSSSWIENILKRKNEVSFKPIKLENNEKHG